MILRVNSALAWHLYHLHHWKKQAGSVTSVVERKQFLTELGFLLKACHGGSYIWPRIIRFSKPISVKSLSYSTDGISCNFAAWMTDQPGSTKKNTHRKRCPYGWPSWDLLMDQPHCGCWMSLFWTGWMSFPCWEKKKRRRISRSTWDCSHWESEVTPQVGKTSCNKKDRAYTQKHAEVWWLFSFGESWKVHKEDNTERVSSKHCLVMVPTGQGRL